MAWRELLLGTIVVSVVAVGIPGISFAAAADRNESCVGWGASLGNCQNPPESNGSINGGGVDVSAGIESGSNGSGNENSEPDESAGPNDLGGNAGTIGAPDAIDREDYVINCIPNSPCDPNFTVSISDLVNFTPAKTSTGMEPNGWAVVGLPANFMARASAHTQSGQLLGFPADVRFTPVGYRWSFGDGTTATSATGGSTWGDQGLPEFSDTVTSHRFAESGSFVIVGTVIYTAEYRFAGRSWQGIAGTLAVSADPFTAVAGQAKTVLVNDECQADPRGPGC